MKDICMHTYREQSKVHTISDKNSEWHMQERLSTLLLAALAVTAQHHAPAPMIPSIALDIRLPTPMPAHPL